MNSRGDILEGRERYWITDDIWIEQSGSDTTGWKVTTSQGQVLSDFGASELKAGGGQWAAYPPARGNFGTIPSGGIVRDIGFDGTIAWCPDRQSGAPNGIWGGELHDINPRTVRVCGHGHLVACFYDGRIWSNRLGFASLPSGVRPFSAQTVDDWLLYYTNEHLILQRYGAPEGVILAEKPTYAPDMVKLPDGTLKVAWCPNPAEIHAQFTLFPIGFAVRDLRDIHDTPVPVVPPEPKPEPTPMPVAPNKLADVQNVIATHPEIARTTDGPFAPNRGGITQLVAQRLGLPWGRKSKDKSATNLSDDALCYLLPDGRFEIYDILNGSSGDATWDYKGTFANGENGYFLAVSGSTQPPAPSTQTLDSLVRGLIEAALAPLRAEIAALKAQQPPAPKPVSINGVRVALRTDNNSYVTAEDGGGGDVNATRQTVGGWETFTLETH